MFNFQELAEILTKTTTKQVGISRQSEVFLLQSIMQNTKVVTTAARSQKISFSRSNVGQNVKNIQLKAKKISYTVHM